MIWMILIALLTVVILLEIMSLNRFAEAVRVEFEVDRALTEPGEIFNLTYSVTNRTRFPLFFCALAIKPEEGTEVREDDEFIRTHVEKGYTGTSVNYRFFLWGYRRFKGKLRLSFTARGTRHVGRYYLEIGDFLGFKSRIFSQDTGLTAVCTSEVVTDMEAIETIGGMIGDISVRRFIHEDPNLVAGYQAYTGREPMRDISWVQTAKTGQLMVKKKDYTMDTDVAVAVNLEKTGDGDMERCLSLVRTVCETLEQRKIPYSFMSNGDLFDLKEGLGRHHLNQILRRIGLSGPVNYTSFETLADRVLREGDGQRSLILVTPAAGEDGKKVITALERNISSRLFVLEA